MSLLKPRLTLVKSAKKTRPRSLAKGIAAGLIGGLVATAARSFARKVYPPHRKSEHPELPPPEPGTRALALRKRIHESRGLHWGLGAAAGAAYGAVAEYYPAATQKDGAGFGMALAAITTQEGPLSTLGLVSPTETPREKSSEITSFVVFGIVTETVRRIVRRLL